MADEAPPPASSGADAVDWFGADAPAVPPHRSPDAEGSSPGSTRAREQGCICSVLGNAAYRVGAAERPLVDPDCAIHRPA